MDWRRWLPGRGPGAANRQEPVASPAVLLLGVGSLVASVVVVGLAHWALGLAGVLVATVLMVAASVVAMAGTLGRSYALRSTERSDLTDLDEATIKPNERELIASIIDFGDTVVREVMVPRLDMITVDAQFRVADVMEVMLLNGYSRLPACGRDIDDVVGLVYAKDLMRAERDGLEDRAVSEHLRTATFVPETKRLPELLRQMQQDKFHMAVVIDEYGGTAGLVTLEDIIEELVGEIVDEYDVEDPMIEPMPGGDALVRGRTSLDEVNDLLHAELPEGDWDTVGGLVYGLMGHVPVEGESVEIAGWRLTAQRIQGRRIGRVRMARLPRRNDQRAHEGEVASNGAVGDDGATPDESG
jgi:CBS domain containing-hemolysin-like protein